MGWNGYGVCSNLASSGEPPPASQNHFNHWSAHSVFDAVSNVCDFVNNSSCNTSIYKAHIWGTGTTGLMRSLATLPEVERPSGEHRVSRSTECDIFFLQCSNAVGWATRRASGLYKAGHWFVWVWWFDWSFACLTAPVVTTTCVIRSSNKIQNGDILIPAYPGCPGKRLLSERHYKACVVSWVGDWYSCKCLHCQACAVWNVCNRCRAMDTSVISWMMKTST